jgi:hypothetical protein
MNGSNQNAAGDQCWKERAKVMIEGEWLADAVRGGHSVLHRRNLYSSDFVPVESIATWEEFKQIVRGEFPDKRWIFRGHSNSSWRLETSLERAVLRLIDEGPNRSPRESYVVAHPNELEPSCHRLCRMRQCCGRSISARPTGTSSFAS